VYSHLMLILAAGLVIGLIGFGIVAFVTGGAAGLESYERDSAASDVPAELTADAVSAVRFDVVLRGYRMDQVDALIDRFVAELRDRDQQLAARAADSPPVAPEGA
jgi:DivIVA domain-containing protein